jgi:hypothetical protein
VLKYRGWGIAIVVALGAFAAFGLCGACGSKANHPEGIGDCCSDGPQACANNGQSLPLCCSSDKDCAQTQYGPTGGSECFDGECSPPDQ